MDTKPAGEQLKVDPFEATLEKLSEIHKEQVLALLLENEEMKEKLQAVLITTWDSGDATEVKGSSKQSADLHLTTTTPEYLKPQWLWTVTEEEQTKFAQKFPAAQKFSLLSGWYFGPEDFPDEAMTEVRSSTEDGLLSPFHHKRPAGNRKSHVALEGTTRQISPESKPSLRDKLCCIRRRTHPIQDHEVSHESKLSCCDKLCKTYSRFLIMSPDSIKRLTWDIAGMLLLLYDIIMIPVGAFGPERTAFLKAMDWVTLFFWSGDMIASLFTGYIDNEGVAVMDKRRILIRYLKLWFWLDLFIVSADWASTLLETFMDGQGDSASNLAGLLRVFRAIRVVRLLRLAKLKRLLQMAKDLLALQGN
jgi:hypothetical protein